MTGGRAFPNRRPAETLLTLEFLSAVANTGDVRHHGYPSAETARYEG
jgi:hypothetical protein